MIDVFFSNVDDFCHFLKGNVAFGLHVNHTFGSWLKKFLKAVS